MVSSPIFFVLAIVGALQVLFCGSLVSADAQHGVPDGKAWRNDTSGWIDGWVCVVTHLPIGYLAASTVGSRVNLTSSMLTLGITSSQSMHPKPLRIRVTTTLPTGLHPQL